MATSISTTNSPISSSVASEDVLVAAAAVTVSSFDGLGGDGDASLINCDNNNNELLLSKEETNCSSCVSIPVSLSQSLKDHASGDQSIDSGVAGGDSDEADCCPNPSPSVIVRPTSSSSSSSSSLLSGANGGGGSASGDELLFKERNSSNNSLPMSPAENFEQDQFFMNGIDRPDEDDDVEDQEGLDGQPENDEQEPRESNSALAGSLETGGQGNKGDFAQDCKICQ